MEGQIDGEDGEYLKIYVIDNNGTEHNITIEIESGEIAYHEQDGYPDEASKRTTEENEYVNQARRYAKWYVYRERGYDTLAPPRNPDRIAATFLTIYGLDTDEIDRYLGTFYQQLRSHYDDSVARPVALEPEADSTQVVYKQHLYLDTELDDVHGISEEYAEDIGEIARQTSAQIGSFQNATELFGNLLNAFTGGEVDPDSPDVDTPDEEAALPDLALPRYDIEGLSDLYYLYHRGNAGARTVERADPFEREPDTRIEILAMTPVSTQFQFKLMLLRHLACQIRDIYIEMGAEPPEPFRLLGPGIHNSTLKYKLWEMYPNYFDTLTDIPGYVA